jgi:hypothetical protein
MQEDFDRLYNNKATETKNLIGGFMRYLRSAPKNRRKQKPPTS